MRSTGARFASIAALVGLVLAGACAPATGPPPAAPAAPAPSASAAPSRAAAPPAPSFAGKTITILIPYTVGGAADIMARQMLPFMGQHFPANRAIIVQNMPGAGGIVGENWVYNVGPKDGTVIGQFSTVLADAILVPDGVQFDLAKLRWLGGVSETTVSFVATDLGIKTPEQLLQVSQPIFLGESSAQSTRGLNPRLLLRLLDKEHRFVPGYGSSGDQRAALLRGEVNMTADSLSGYFAAVKPLIQDGEVVPLAQEGRIQDGQIVRDPRLPDVPTYTELAVKLKGEGVKQRPEYRALELLARMGGIQRGWVYAPGVPEGTVVAMAAALEATLADPELLQAYERIVGFRPVVLSGAQAQTIVDSVLNLTQANPDALDLLRRLAQETE